MNRRKISILFVALCIFMFSACSLFDPYGNMTTPRLFAKLDGADSFWCQAEVNENGVYGSMYLAICDRKMYLQVEDSDVQVCILADVSNIYMINHSRKLIQQIDASKMEQYDDIMADVRGASRKKQDWTCGNETVNGYLYYYEETVTKDGQKLRVYYTGKGSEQIRFISDGTMYINVTGYGINDVDMSVFELPQGYQVITLK